MSHFGEEDDIIEGKNPSLFPQFDSGISFQLDGHVSNTHLM